MATSVVSESLRKTGFRMTRQRRIVVEILASANDHPTVADIHARARGRDPLIAVSTVYRILVALEEAGLVERRVFSSPEGGPVTAQYELADQAPHDHLVDLASGAVIDFQDDALDAMKRAIAERLGYRMVVEPRAIGEGAEVRAGSPFHDDAGTTSHSIHLGSRALIDLIHV